MQLGDILYRPMDEIRRRGGTRHQEAMRYDSWSCFPGKHLRLGVGVSSSFGNYGRWRRVGDVSYKGNPTVNDLLQMNRLSSMVH